MATQDRRTTYQLVTGAGRDIGQAIAEALGGPGTFTLLHYSSSQTGAQQTLERLQAAGGDGALIQADFSDASDVQRFAEQVRELIGDGQLQTIVHNAAATEATPLTEDILEGARRMLHVNVLAPTLLTHALSSSMADGGAIITLSVAATDKVFSPDFGFFSASKAALDTLVRHWAVALGSRGIRVNGVAPGVVEVNFRANLLQDPGFRSQLEQDTALGRPAQVSDIADVVAFLASDQSRWITGQIVEASGGWRL